MRSRDAESLWVSEVWQDQASHEASLTLPACSHVQEAMTAGKPLVAGFRERTMTEPVGGMGARVRVTVRVATDVIGA